MPQETETKYTFAIDTDSYAGNFERNFLAYCTGAHLDNYHKNSEVLREKYQQEVGYEDENEYLEFRSGPTGHAPSLVDIGQTPGSNEFNTVLFFLRDRPPKKVLDLWVRRAHDLVANHEAWKATDPRTFIISKVPNNIIGFRLLTHVTTTTSEQLG